MPTAQTILDRKGKDVATVDRNTTVLDAAILMNQRKIGAVVVRDGERAVGIFTERDILNRVVAAKRSPDATKVGDVMTSPMACCRRDTPIEECRSVMASKGIRHLPVVEDGRACGMISSRDILADEVKDQQSTIEYLNEYLHGRT